MTACAAAAVDRVDGTTAPAGGDSGACLRTTAVLCARPGVGGDVPGALHPAMPASAAAATRVGASFIRTLSYSSPRAGSALRRGATSGREGVWSKVSTLDMTVAVAGTADRGPFRL